MRRQRQLHDARRRRRRAGAADEEDDASLEGLLCESEDRLCRKLQDMQERMCKRKSVWVVRNT